MKTITKVFLLFILLAATGCDPDTDAFGQYKSYRCTKETSQQAGEAFAACLYLGGSNGSGSFPAYRAEKCGASAWDIYCRVENPRPATTAPSHPGKEK